MVQLIAEGKSNKTIADTLAISQKTVETHRAAAMRKLHLEFDCRACPLRSAEQVREAMKRQLRVCTAHFRGIPSNVSGFPPMAACKSVREQFSTSGLPSEEARMDVCNCAVEAN